MKIYLRDRNQKIVDAWKSSFQDILDVAVTCGDILDISADAIISPANSFGFMDGGIDLAYSNFFGAKLQVNLQKTIQRKWYGEIPVGQAEIIKTENNRIKYLISCPTMRVPEDVSKTVNAYLSFRAGLIAVEKWNMENREKIESILCPGLGTLTGRISPKACAIQMKTAYDSIVLKKIIFPDMLWNAREVHSNMLGIS